jgi:hypothetical protein
MQQETTQTPGTEMFNQTATAKAEDQKAEVTKKEEPKKEQPIYLGGKKFNTVEELAIYTQRLEQEKNTTAHTAPTTQAPKEKAISELLFEDPEKALALHEQKVISKLKAEENQRKQEQEFWTKFYSENKDLEESSDIVQFTLNKAWQELETLHPEQASQKLAEYTRKTISRFRGTQETKNALPSGQAKAGPASTQSAPAVTESRPAAVDFVSQLKKIQRSRKHN